MCSVGTAANASSVLAHEAKPRPVSVSARSSDGGRHAYPAGAPAHERLKAEAVPIAVRGRTVRVASLDHLIAMKEAAGRPRDKVMAWSTGGFPTGSESLKAERPHGTARYRR